MSIYIENEGMDLPLAEEKILQNMEKVLQAEECEGDISIALVSNQRIREIHHQFLSEDTETDVLSFPLWEEGEEDDMLGEIVASVEKAREEAEKRGVKAEEELMLYLIHGFLHLMGHDDKDPQKADLMHQREDELLQMLGYSYQNL